MPAETDPTRTVLTDAEAEAQAHRIIADFATSYRDQTPVPRYGDAPPVPQPGIPPMSQRTTETARAVMFCSLATVPPGLIAVAVMVASEHANPTVIGMICAAPAAIAVPILALARLLRGAKDLPPAEVHHHYSGHVDQRTVHTKTTGLWARTNNQQ
ncbi:hypothetical protein ACIPIC_02625 [Streptomyces collinus]|uniref:hypothetical protein n=1 Tax=Streptomyces collinus TaxID=42684 RepID=UPI0038255FB2